MEVKHISIPDLFYKTNQGPNQNQPKSCRLIQVKFAWNITFNTLHLTPAAIYPTKITQPTADITTN